MPRVVPPERRCWRPSEWPATDLAAWQKALRPTHPLDEAGGEAAHLRPETVRLYENAYGRWLSWLCHHRQLNLDEAPSERATHDLVQAYYRSLRADGLADFTVTNFLGGLASVLKAMEPGGQFEWIRKAANNVRRSAKPAKDIQERLRPPEDLLSLGEAMLAEAESGRFRRDRDRALLARDGLIISLLVCCPLRAQNFSGIRLNEHLVNEGGRWSLRFAPQETKNSRPYEAPWPDNLVESLERYLSVHRPVLTRGRTEDALWVTQGARPMREGDLYDRVALHTRMEFGVSTNPHSFRHIAATAIATDDPEGVAGIAGVLGHASSKTGEVHYNKAKAIESGHRYQQTVEAIRSNYRKHKRKGV